MILTSFECEVMRPSPIWPYMGFMSLEFRSPSTKYNCVTSNDQKPTQLNNILSVSFYAFRHQLLVPSSHSRWHIRSTKATTESYYIHIAAIGRVGNGIRSNTLSRCFHPRRFSDENQFDRGSSPGNEMNDDYSLPKFDLSERIWSTLMKLAWQPKQFITKTLLILCVMSLNMI